MGAFVSSIQAFKRETGSRCLRIMLWFKSSSRLPGGQITWTADFGLSSPFCKNILIFRSRKSPYILRPSCPTEGRLEIVTDAGQDAVDGSGAKDEGAWLADGEVVWS